MIRVCVPAMPAIWLTLSLFFGAPSASAATYSLDITGTAADGSTPVQGNITFDLPDPPSQSGTIEQRNSYSNSSVSYSFELGGATYSGSGTGAFNSVAFIKSTGTANFFGAPFVALNVNTFSPDSLSLVIASVNPDLSLPLLTFETMPTTLAAWVATYGPIHSLPAVLANIPGNYIRLSSYTLTTVAATPIPAALLMFGTGLAGLGVAGARRYRLLRKASKAPAA